MFGGLSAKGLSYQKFGTAKAEKLDAIRHKTDCGPISSFAHPFNFGEISRHARNNYSGIWIICHAHGFKMTIESLEEVTYLYSGGCIYRSTNATQKYEKREPAVASPKMRSQ